MITFHLVFISLVKKSLGYILLDFCCSRLGLNYHFEHCFFDQNLAYRPSEMLIKGLFYGIENVD